MARHWIKTSARYWHDTGRILSTQWSDGGNTLGRHWQEIGKTLKRHWQNIGNTLARQSEDSGNALARQWQDISKTVARQQDMLARNTGYWQASGWQDSGKILARHPPDSGKTLAMHWKDIAKALAGNWQDTGNQNQQVSKPSINICITQSGSPKADPPKAPPPPRARRIPRAQSNFSTGRRAPQRKMSFRIHSGDPPVKCHAGPTSLKAGATKGTACGRYNAGWKAGTYALNKLARPSAKPTKPATQGIRSGWTGRDCQPTRTASAMSGTLIALKHSKNNAKIEAKPQCWLGQAESHTIQGVLCKRLRFHTSRTCGPGQRPNGRLNSTSLIVHTGV